MSEEWQVGDLVAYRGGMPDRWHIRRVERITPSGLLCLDGNAGTKLRSKNEMLSEVGDSRNWVRAYWRRVSPEIREQAARERAIDRLSATKWSELPDKTLFAVIRMVKEAEQEVTP